MNFNSIRFRSAHNGVKIKIKILISTSQTPAAVKISLPHSKSNDLAHQFDGVLKFCHNPTGPSKLRYKHTDLGDDDQLKRCSVLIVLFINKSSSSAKNYSVRNILII
eukprot:sb/3477661/